MDEKKKSRLLLYTLATVQAFVGLTAILGGFELVSDPSGAKSNLPLEWLSSSPFTNYFIPGLVLVVVIGIGNSIGAAFTLFRGRYSDHLAALLGLFLILYMSIEVLFVGLRNALQPSY